MLHRPYPPDPAALVARVRTVAERGDARSLARLDGAIADGVTSSPQFRAALATSDLDKDRVATLGRVLVREATRRDVVGIGLLLIEFGGELERDAPLLLALGAHPAFTVLAAHAIRGIGASDRDLLRFAARADEDDLLTIVRLLDGTADPEVRGWLLRDACADGTTDSRLAMACARVGGLPAALDAAEVDGALLAGATAILGALARAEVYVVALDDYPDGVRVVTDWVRHVEARPTAEAVAVAGLMLDGHDDGVGPVPARTLPPGLRARLAAFRDAAARSGITATGADGSGGG